MELYVESLEPVQVAVKLSCDLRVSTVSTLPPLIFDTVGGYGSYTRMVVLVSPYVKFPTRSDNTARK